MRLIALLVLFVSMAGCTATTTAYKVVGYGPDGSLIVEEIVPREGISLEVAK